MKKPSGLKRKRPISVWAATYQLRVLQRHIYTGLGRLSFNNNQVWQTVCIQNIESSRVYADVKYKQYIQHTGVRWILI